MWDFANDVSEVLLSRRGELPEVWCRKILLPGLHPQHFTFALYRNKVTQLQWVVDDFVYRFDHRPQGIWLPETAADIETLCVLQDCGLEFTILAPWQVRPLESKPGPYYVELPDGRKPFIVFPYHRDLSTKVSFIPKATENGDEFLSSIRLTRVWI